MAGPIKFEQLIDITPESTQKAIAAVNQVKAAYEAALKGIKAEAESMHKSLSGKSVGGDADNKAIADLNAQISRLSQKYVELKNQRDKAMGAAKKFAIQNTELKKTVKDNTDAFDRLNKKLRENQKQTKTNTSLWKRMVSGMSSAVAVGSLMATAVRGGLRALTTGIKDAIGTMAGFESSMAGVRAITKATDDEFIKLERDAIRLGGATIFTARQVSDLQVAYGKLGFNTTEIINATQATLELAAATDEGLASAARVAGTTLRAFQLDAIEMQRVVDVMAESFTSSALDVEKFREAMKFLAPVARKAGFSLEDTTAILAKLADTGLYGSLAGTSMRNILLKMSDSTSSLSKQLGFTVNSMDSFLVAMQTLRDAGVDLSDALELTDMRAVTAFSTLIDGVGGLNKLRDSLMGAASAAKTMADTRMDTLIGKTTILKSAWEGLVLQINEGTGSTRQFGAIIDWVTGRVQALKRALTDQADTADIEAQQFSQDRIDRIKKEIAEARDLRFKETQSSIDAVKAEYDVKKISQAEYINKVKELSKDFSDFQANELRKRLTAEQASLQSQVDSVDEATKIQIASYKFRVGMYNDMVAAKKAGDKALIKSLDKTIGKQAEILQVYLNQEQALKDVNEVLRGMSQQALITGEGLKDLSDDAFKDWMTREKARIGAMRDGMAKEIAERRLSFAIQKHELDNFLLSTVEAHKNMEADIADIESKWAKKRSEAKIKAMASGLQKEVAEVYQSYQETIEIIEEAGLSTEIIIAERNRKIQQIYTDHFTKIFDIHASARAARIAEAQKLADLEEQIAETSASIIMQDQINARNFSQFTEKQNKDFLKRIEEEKADIINKTSAERLNRTITFLDAESEQTRIKIDQQKSLLKDDLEETVRLEIENHIKRLEAQLIFNNKQTELVKQQIAELESLRAGIGKDTTSSGFSIWSIFGIDENDVEGGKFVTDFKKLMGETMSILEDTVDFEVDMADRAVDASQNRLDNLIANLDIENQKKQEGYANNVSSLEDSIRQEQAVLKKAERDQKLALKRKRNLEAATQTVNMITATTEIIKSASAYGGVAAPFIAGGLIAAMWGLFLGAQARAGAIGYKDGVIDLQGPGTGTSDAIPARLSKGETVMTADETKVWKPVFTAIRNNDPALAMMEMARITKGNNDSGGNLQRITLSHNLDSIMQKYYGRKIEYSGDYMIETTGNLTRRIRIR